MNSIRTCLSNLFRPAYSCFSSFFSPAPKAPKASAVEIVAKAITEQFPQKFIRSEHLKNNEKKHPTGVLEISVLSCMISIVKSKKDTAMVLPLNKSSEVFQKQIELAMESSKQQAKRMNDTATSRKELQMTNKFAQVRYAAEQSVLSKLPAFVESKIGIIQDLQALRNESPKDYNRAIRSLRTTAGNEIADSVHELARLDLQY